MRMRTKFMAFLCMVCSHVYAADYVIKQGKGYAICEAVKAALNRLPESDNAAMCNRKAAGTIPGLYEPQWRDLDIEEHWDLFLKFNRYDLKKSDGPVFSNLMASWRQQAKSGAIKMQVLQTNLIASSPDTQTIIRVLRQKGCGNTADDSSMHLVKPDLSDLDIAVESHLYWLPRADLDLFGDKPYIVYWNLGDKLLISSPAIDSSLYPFCAIESHKQGKQTR